MNPELRKEIETVNPMLEGWCWPEKAVALADSLLDHPDPKIIVEIGVFGGRSLIPMAQAARSRGSGTVFGIDPWQRDAALECEADQANVEWWTKNVQLHEVHRKCVEAIWAQRLQDWCVLMRCKSEIAVRAFANLSVDILHVDGNHNEELSCRDVTLWLPKVKSGGLIWLDDVHWPQTAKSTAIVEASCDRAVDIAKDNFGSSRMYRKQ